MLTDFSNAYIFIDVRGIGAVGSALHSHCRGREFESHMLQEPESVDFTALSGFIYVLDMPVFFFTKKYLERALYGVPENFSGKLLEVPVGTGVLTMPVYADLPDADITCLDYSEKMMASAKKKAETMGLSRIRFLQGDVGSLPFEDESFDVVLSLNGFHAFPDKEAAYDETYRVLKKGGVFCGCFYIQGACRRTDWFIRHLYQPKGFFTPPYETKQSLKQSLEQRYAKVKVASVEGMGCFRCLK